MTRIREEEEVQSITVLQISSVCSKALCTTYEISKFFRACVTSPNAIYSNMLTTWCRPINVVRSQFMTVCEGNISKNNVKLSILQLWQINACTIMMLTTNGCNGTRGDCVYCVPNLDFRDFPFLIYKHSQDRHSAHKRQHRTNHRLAGILW